MVSDNNQNSRIVSVNKDNQRTNVGKRPAGRLESLGANKTVYHLNTPIIPTDLKIQGDDLEGFDPYNNDQLGKAST